MYIPSQVHPTNGDYNLFVFHSLPRMLCLCWTNKQSLLICVALVFFHFYQQFVQAGSCVLLVMRKFKTNLNRIEHEASNSHRIHGFIAAIRVESSSSFPLVSSMCLPKQKAPARYSPTPTKRRHMQAPQCLSRWVKTNRTRKS